MSAHDELRALLQRYARAVDQRDIGALIELFHPDAEISGARGPSLDGVARDHAGAPRLPLEHAPPRRTSHHPRGGADVATFDTYAVVYQLSDAGSGDLTLGIRYLDEAVRSEGRWVIRRRTAETLWMR